MNKQHLYTVSVEWKDPSGQGTADYRTYQRDHLISVSGKPPILASSDPAFRGNETRYNPEELFLASLSSCHMLWYLHLCADAGVIVLDYTDNPTALMEENHENGGQFKKVTLRPLVIIREQSMIPKAEALHAEAHRLCFIANSINFPVYHEAIHRIGR